MSFIFVKIYGSKKVNIVVPNFTIPKESSHYSGIFEKPTNLVIGLNISSLWMFKYCMSMTVLELAKDVKSQKKRHDVLISNLTK